MPASRKLERQSRLSKEWPLNVNIYSTFSDSFAILWTVRMKVARLCAFIITLGSIASARRSVTARLDQLCNIKMVYHVNKMLCLIWLQRSILEHAGIEVIDNDDFTNSEAIGHLREAA